MWVDRQNASNRLWGGTKIAFVHRFRSLFKVRMQLGGCRTRRCIRRRGVLS